MKDKLYKITYLEHINYEFEVQANSKEEAEEKLVAMRENGELDFSNGEIVLSEIYDIEEVEEE